MIQMPVFLYAALLGVLVATTVAFYQVEPRAALLMLPYLVWTSYATALTAKIKVDNEQVSSLRDQS